MNPINNPMKNPQSSLPPGFRFHPTDEELILHYLKQKVSSIPIPVSIIAEVDIYKFDPWELPAQATFGEKEWYFFTPRDRKYPNGARPNRAAGSGYWKATGTDKIITTTTVTSMTSQSIENVGVKKALVFYKGRPPKGTKTNWIMHEYRLAESLCNANTVRSNKLKESPMRLDDWVLCRIYKKSNVLSSSGAAMASPLIDVDQEEEEPFILQDTKSPSITNFPNANQILNHPLMPQKSPSYTNLFDAVDYSMLSSFLSDPINQTNDMLCFDQNSYTLDQVDPTLHNYPVPSLEEPPMMQNGLKRQRLSIDAEMSHPSKKLCNFANNGQFEGPTGQYNMFNHSSTMWNQQLLLGSNVQFLG